MPISSLARSPELRVDPVRPRASRTSVPSAASARPASRDVRVRADRPGPAIAQPTGRNLNWRQGLGALKNLTFMPMWHNTHDTIHQFFAMQTVPHGAPAAPWRVEPLDTGALRLPEHATLDAFLKAQQVDSFALLHDGALVHEQYTGGMTVDTRHSIASMTRTLTGVVAGMLVDAGRLDLTSEVQTFAPELADTAWNGVTVRNLLDMRSGITSSVPACLKAMGAEGEGLRTYLLGLPRDGATGGPFKYRTGDTEMLAYLCEAVTGKPMAGLWSDMLWQPMGAASDAGVMLDAHGTPLCGGGMTATLRDTARFAQTLLDDGAGVIPAWYVEDMRRGDADARAAFGGTMIQLPLPGAMYRNQAWLLDAHAGVSLLMGAGGQLAYLDPQNRFACLATSHWLMPYDAKRMATWLGTFGHLRDQVLAQRSAP